jgi:uncharacterized protein
MSEHGDVWWTELNTHHADKAVKFYSKLLGLEAHTSAMADMSRPPKPGEPAYTTFMKGGKPHLGCFQMEGEHFKQVPDHWLTYFAVKDVDKAAKDVATAGGGVMREPFDVPGVGRIAIVKDVNGGVFGLGTPAAMGAPAAAEMPAAKPKKAKAKA